MANNSLTSDSSSSLEVHRQLSLSDYYSAVDDILLVSVLPHTRSTSASPCSVNRSKSTTIVRLAM
jgi:hypothetical protein